jgi:hypothetical protein
MEIILEFLLMKSIELLLGFILQVVRLVLLLMLILVQMLG